MNYATILSRASQGLNAPLVRVEVHLSAGLPAFAVVGMPETAVRESRDRVRSAILNSHFEFPDGRITVNLAPADLPKGGGRFDLPIALGILCATGQLPQSTVTASECLGELALDGSLRHGRGTVSAVMAATAAARRCLLPLDSAQRCQQVPGSRLIGAANLLELCAVLRGRIEARALEPLNSPATGPLQDLADVAGQRGPRRALEIAAAGGHHMLMIGPPGTGKSLIARCLPGILPPPSAAEQLASAAIHDLQGEHHDGTTRSFRCPHHSASAAALVGGGSVPGPGEISLAHGGVLFLDELAEFSRHTLDMLREPLETGEISLARARCRVRYPARFQLLAAMNPCACGFAGDTRRECRCSTQQRLQYAGRVSGPLLDRIDVQVRVEREDPIALLERGSAESSAAVARRVSACWQRQFRRQGCNNANLPVDRLLELCALSAFDKNLLRRAAKRALLSSRAVHRCLRTARTIADLRGEDSVGSAALTEALGYRSAFESRTGGEE